MSSTSRSASLLVAFASTALFALGCGPAKPEAGRAGFEAKFMAVHKAYNAVMESAH